MKKTYMHPEMDTIEVKHRQALLDASLPPLGDDYEEGDEILTREFLDFDE